MRLGQGGDPLRGSPLRQPIGTRQGQDRLRAWGAKRLRAAVPRSGRRQTLFAVRECRRSPRRRNSLVNKGSQLGRRQFIEPGTHRLDGLVEHFKQDEGETLLARPPCAAARTPKPRSEEHTSELQSLMRISYAVFCLKKKKPKHLNPK